MLRFSDQYRDLFVQGEGLRGILYLDKTGL